MERLQGRDLCFGPNWVILLHFISSTEMEFCFLSNVEIEWKKLQMFSDIKSEQEDSKFIGSAYFLFATNPNIPVTK